MVKRGFLEKHGVVRNAIREDLLFFGIPALLVFTAGLVVSGRDGYDGLTSTVWGMVKNPENLDTLSVMNIAGLCLFVVGLTTAIVGAVTLRRFYASTLVIRDDHRLITHGLYRFSRHPIYLGALIAIFSAPVYASSLYGLVTMSVLIPIFLIRIRIEEGMLVGQFGDAYRTYMKSTSKLIPFIY